MSSEAGLRFSRGIHPAQSMRGLKRAIQLMHELGGGAIAQGEMDLYPAPAPVNKIDLPMAQVERLIGIPFKAEDATDILRRLQFEVAQDGDILHVTVPDHRVDISTGDVGISDLCEELARIYGYDRIPNTLIEDMLPPQQNTEALAREERTRDLLVQAGLRETVNYRLTTPEAETRLTPPGQKSSWPDSPYVTLANPISLDKVVMRHTLLNAVLENIATNQRHHTQQKLFEVGSVFLPVEGQMLPDEPRRLALALTGPRLLSSWQDGNGNSETSAYIDFFDLKGVLESLAHGLRIGSLTFQPTEHSSFHPGRCAAVYLGKKQIGVAGELHPLVREAYELEQPVMAAELDLDRLLEDIPLVDQIMPILTQPAVYQDIALIVSEQTQAAEVERVITQAGGELLREVKLFDV